MRSLENKKMRVLWFTNIPLPAVQKKLGTTPVQLARWGDELRIALQETNHIQLGAASISMEDYGSFEDEGVQYYNIVSPDTPSRLPSQILKYVRRWQHPLDIPDFFPQCIQILEAFQPDVIHVHGTESGFGLIQKETEIPVVISLQGILSVISKVYFKGMTSKDLVGEILTKEYLSGRGMIHGYYTMRKAARREHNIVRQGCNFIGRTEFDRRFVELHNPIASYFHCDEVMRSPFYESVWHPDSLPRKVIYCTSSNNPYKGLECLVEAVAILKAEGQTYQLRIAGSGGTENWRWIKQRVRRLDLGKEVTWLGSLDGQEITAELEAASVYVLPSHIENSPNSLAEAMMVGTPCIASRVGGVPSLMEDGINGLLFNDGDAQALADKIGSVTTDPVLAMNLSAEARKTARIRHDRHQIATKMVKIYQSVANSTQS